MGCNGCGSSSGDARMRIVRGAMYRRSGLWTRKLDGVVEPLDAADWTALLVIRRNLEYPTTLLELISGDGITLTTEDDSIRFHIEIPADVTATLPIGKNFRYTLAMISVLDPEDVRALIPAGYADVVDTAL